MKTEKLLQENPKVSELLQKWFFDKLTQSFKDFDKDEAFKDYMMEKGVSERQVMATMKDNPHGCFNFLDEKGYIIIIQYDKLYQTWYYSCCIDDTMTIKDNITYHSRIDCERAGLEYAIVELEKVLKK